MKRTSRRKTLSHSQIENFLSDMSVTGTRCSSTKPSLTIGEGCINDENINIKQVGHSLQLALQAADTNKDHCLSKSTYSSQKSSSVSSRTRSAKTEKRDHLVHEVQSIRDFVRGQFEVLTIANGDRPLRRCPNVLPMPTCQMTQLAKDVLATTKYPICSSRFLRPDLYLHPIQSLEAKKTLLLSLSPMLSEAEHERQKEVSACEQFTRCRSSRGKSRSSSYEYSDFDAKQTVSHSDYEGRYKLYATRNKRTYERKTSFCKSETYLTHKIVMEYAALKQKKTSTVVADGANELRASLLQECKSLSTSGASSSSTINITSTAAISTSSCKSIPAKESSSSAAAGRLANIFADDTEAKELANISGFNSSERKSSKSSNTFATGAVESLASVQGVAVRKLAARMRKNGTELQQPQKQESQPTAPPATAIVALTAGMIAHRPSVPLPSAAQNSSRSESSRQRLSDFEETKLQSAGRVCNDRKRKQRDAVELTSSEVYDSTRDQNSSAEKDPQHIRTVERRGTLSPASVRKMLMQACADTVVNETDCSDAIISAAEDDEDCSVSDNSSSCALTVSAEVDVVMGTDGITFVDDCDGDDTITEERSSKDRKLQSRRTSYELPPALSAEDMLETLLPTEESDMLNEVDESAEATRSDPSSMEVESFGKELDELLFDEDEDDFSAFNAPNRRSLDYNTISESIAQLAAEDIVAVHDDQPTTSTAYSEDVNEVDDYSQVDEIEASPVSNSMIDASETLQQGVFTNYAGPSPQQFTKNHGPFDLPSPQKHIVEEAVSVEEAESAIEGSTPASPAVLEVPKVEAKSRSVEKKIGSRVSAIPRLSPIAAPTSAASSPLKNSSATSSALLSHVNVLLSDSPVSSPLASIITKSSTLLPSPIALAASHDSDDFARLVPPRPDDHQRIDSWDSTDNDNTVLISPTDHPLDDSTDDFAEYPLNALVATDLAAFELLESIVESKYQEGSLSPLGNSPRIEPSTDYDIDHLAPSSMNHCTADETATATAAVNIDFGASCPGHRDVDDVQFIDEDSIPIVFDISAMQKTAAARMQGRMEVVKWKYHWEMVSYQAANHAIKRLRSAYSEKAAATTIYAFAAADQSTQ